MQYILEHFGVSVAAITGVLAARGKQVDLFGVLVLALVTAFGGGTIRDLALGLVPVFWTADSTYLINAAITAVVTFYLVRFLLIGEIPLVFRREIYLYATAAFIGASVFVLANRWSSNPQTNMFIGTAATLALRLAGIRWRIALPMFRPKM